MPQHYNLNPVDLIRQGITEVSKAAGFKEGRVNKAVRKSGTTLGSSPTRKASASKAKASAAPRKTKLSGNSKRQEAIVKQLGRRGGTHAAAKASVLGRERQAAMKADRALRDRPAGKAKNRRKNKKKGSK